MVCRQQIHRAGSVFLVLAHGPGAPPPPHWTSIGGRRGFAGSSRPIGMRLDPIRPGDPWRKGLWSSGASGAAGIEQSSGSSSAARSRALQHARESLLGAGKRHGASARALPVLAMQFAVGPRPALGGAALTIIGQAPARPHRYGWGLGWRIGRILWLRRIHRAGIAGCIAFGLMPPTNKRDSSA